MSALTKRGAQEFYLGLAGVYNRVGLPRTISATTFIKEPHASFASDAFGPRRALHAVTMEARMRVLGIDEAGRGCVLGPLVLGGFVVEAPSDEALRAAGVDDSKRLSAKKRTAIRASLDALGRCAIREISPAQIDHGNLNQLEEAVVCELVRAYKPDLVILDALGHPRTLPALQTRLAATLAPDGLRPQWLIAPKADHDYPTCGAASIVAKVHRDAQIDALREIWGALGSGYPSDPATRAWLHTWRASHPQWPEFVRTRWGTVRDIEAAHPYSPDHSV